MLLSPVTCVPLCTVALLLVASAQGKACTQSCCLFVENFPSRLKQLRTSFDKIRLYYQKNDDIDTALLDESILQDFKTPFGCHAVNEVLRFYLDVVLPTAVKEVQLDVQHDHKASIDVIGSIFNDLKKEILRCRNFFSCKTPFALDNIMTAYKSMQNKGLYKAMGELDLLFNYIEIYLKEKH